MAVTKAGKSILLTVIASGIASSALPICAFITAPLIARALDPTGRGVMAALLMPVSLLNMMLTLGLPEAITFFVARGQLSVRTAFGLAVLGGVVGGAIGVGLLVALAPFLLAGDVAAFKATYYVIALSLPITLAVAGVRGIVLGLHQFDPLNAERVAAPVFRLLTLSLLLIVGWLGPAIAACTSVVSGIIGSTFLVRAFFSRSALAPTTVTIRTVVRYAGASAFGTVSSMLVYSLDQTLMIPLAGAEQLGFYAIAASFAELPMTVVAVIRDLTFTFSAKDDDPALAARACRLTLLVMIPMCALFIVSTPLLLPLLFGAAFAPAVPMTELLLIGSVFSAITAILGSGLMGAGCAGLRSLIQVAGAILTTILIFLLVPTYGGIGAAWATTLTYAALAAGTVFLYARSVGLQSRYCLIPTLPEAKVLIRTIVSSVSFGRSV